MNQRRRRNDLDTAAACMGRRISAMRVRIAVTIVSCLAVLGTIGCGGGSYGIRGYGSERGGFRRLKGTSVCICDALKVTVGAWLDTGSAHRSRRHVPVRQRQLRRREGIGWQLAGDGLSV